MMSNSRAMDLSEFTSCGAMRSIMIVNDIIENIFEITGPSAACSTMRASCKKLQEEPKDAKIKAKKRPLRDPCMLACF